MADLLKGSIKVPVITDEVIAVWQKGLVIPGEDPDEWRRDEAGNQIRLQDYGNTDSNFGWERHHVVPTAKGGSDHVSNLIPLQWRENRRRGDKGGL